MALALIQLERRWRIHAEGIYVRRTDGVDGWALSMTFDQENKNQNVTDWDPDVKEAFLFLIHIFATIAGNKWDQTARDKIRKNITDLGPRIKPNASAKERSAVITETIAKGEAEMETTQTTYGAGWSTVGRVLRLRPLREIRPGVVLQSPTPRPHNRAF